MASRARSPRLVISTFASVITITAVACSTTSRPDTRAGTDPSSRSAGPERISRLRADLTVNQLVGTTLPAKVLALTFDDGPGDRTAELSTYLAQENIRAAFFINGARIVDPRPGLPQNGITPTANGAAILAQLVADGHLLANHTTSHRDVAQLAVSAPAALVDELSFTDAIIAPHVPANRFLFRAPFGSWSPQSFDVLSPTAMNKYVGPIEWEAGGEQRGYPARTADWACWQGGVQDANGVRVTLAPNPPGYATTQQCGDAYVSDINAFQRGIVLMHDPYSWAQGSTVDMVKYIVPILKGQGYTFVRLDEVPTVAAALPCDATCAACTGPNANQCTSCGDGRYLTAGKQCLLCTACAAGTFQAAACTPSADTVCAACDASCATCTGATAAACASCKAGSFLNGTQCIACTACAPGTFASAACTATADTVCTTCDPSCTTCTGPGPEHCGACPAGSFLANGGCQACTACGAGTYTVAACTPTTNTTCAACATGTWAPAGSATCAACGSCDDGDACTKDACDATKGCSHEAIAGCSHDAGLPPIRPAPSASDGGSPDPGAAPGADPGAAPITIDAGAEGQAAGDDGCSISSTHRATRSGRMPDRREGSAVLLALAASLAVARRRPARR